jgi:hypothetical protein
MSASSTPIVITVSENGNELARLRVEIPKELLEVVQKSARLSGIRQSEIVTEALKLFFTAPIGTAPFSPKNPGVKSEK